MVANTGKGRNHYSRHNQHIATNLGMGGNSSLGMDDGCEPLLCQPQAFNNLLAIQKSLWTARNGQNLVVWKLAEGCAIPYG